MALEIEPEPDEATRAAIEAALAEVDAEQPEPSPWARELLPQREDEA